MPSRVLIVDDDAAIVRMLRRTLEAEGFETATAGDGGAALARAERFVPDVIVLDRVMPGLDGLAVARRLRSKGDGTPILMLTARDAVSDRVDGLEAGADDYLVKPFETVELVARIRALLRRSQPPRVVTLGELRVDPDALTAERAGRRIDLTPREAELLALLVRSAGRAVSRDEALAEVWHDGPRPTGNAVDQHITYLRAKLGDPPLIETVRGVGFVIRR
ncbi:MAG TPA: response regulator transcription factor [Gaiellales bacterium]|nr:response regulator transcription factor [Gaiellales bacterium]